MSENMNDDLQKFEEIEALLSVEEKGADAEDTEDEVEEVEEVAEADEAEETADVTEAEEAEAEEVAEAEEAEAEEAEEAEEAAPAEDADADGELPADAEDPEESVDLEAKAASIMMQMSRIEDDKDETPSMFLSDARFKEMEEDGELISEEKYGTLDMDAKDSYEEVEVYEEGTGKGYGKRYRRRSPLEVNSMRKGGHMEDEEKSEDVEDAEEKAEHGGDMADMFDTVEEALERAAALGCEGTHGAGGKFMPCATHEEWQKLTADKPEAAEKSEEFLCGFQRKSVEQPCDFCDGGCAPEDGLPGLAEIEGMVKDAHSGDILSSGYSSADDMFVVDVKREDGSCIEVFVSGDGDELGWLRIDEEALEGKSAEQINIVSKSDAEASAMSTFTEMNEDVKGEVIASWVDIFGDEDVYVFEIDSEEKSYDFYVSVEGKVLGYDEYELLDDIDYEMSEEDEIKALEAELEIKRMYSREQREAMAESGEAMKDGSFPIADKADLENAIQAFGRATNPEEAKAHIMKRAKELGAEDMIPENWSDDAPEMPAAEAEEKAESDEEILNALDEFRALMEDGLS
jgi:hypothetical protein